jgi:hypothetical protein
MQPDRMAEDFIALQSTGHHVLDYEADPWTDGKLGTVVATVAEVVPIHRTMVLAMAVAVAQRWKAFAHHHLSPLLRANAEGMHGDRAPGCADRPYRTMEKHGPPQPSRTPGNTSLRHPEPTSRPSPTGRPPGES